MGYRTYLDYHIIQPFVCYPDDPIHADAYFAWAKAFGSESRLLEEANKGYGYIHEDEFEDYIRESTDDVRGDLYEYIDWQRYSNAQKRNYKVIMVDGVKFYYEED